ncbi:hypothetical protein ABPG77_007303 [Micractinium sp. CCAP 211/92]
MVLLAGSVKDYDGLAEAAVRGSTSANATKKSFKLDLQKADGSKDKFPFLGMPKDDQWILYSGDEVDLTQGMRNWLTYNLARASGRYASRTVWTEVFLVDDGAATLTPSHYHGIYIGLEKIKVSPDRVNITKMAPPDLSGGYLFSYENDNLEAGDVRVGPLTGWQDPFLLLDPKPKAVPQAVGWLNAYLQAFQDALEAPDWLSRTPGYTSYIDGPAWVDYFLITELTKNPDGYRGSIYFHKDKGAPMAAGPAWDYNEAYGLCCGYPIDGWQRGGVSGPGQSGGSAISPEGWRFMICADPERCQEDPTDGISRWYRRMWTDPRFSGAAATRWAQLRGGVWSDASVQKLIADTAAMIKPAVLRNFERYSAVLLKPWYSSAEQEWTTELANLQSWLLQHLAWMDAALSQAAGTPPVTADAGPVAP